MFSNIFESEKSATDEFYRVVNISDRMSCAILWAYIDTRLAWNRNGIDLLIDSVICRVGCKIHADMLLAS